MNYSSPTFGPSFESPYGFTMMDELHNFFPEVLYDETMFQSRILAYARHRIQTLFGPAYTRQQNIYRMYHQQARVAAYQEWLRTQPSGPGLGPGPVPGPAPVPGPGPMPGPVPVAGLTAAQSHTATASVLNTADLLSLLLPYTTVQPTVQGPVQPSPTQPTPTTTRSTVPTGELVPPNPRRASTLEELARNPLIALMASAMAGSEGMDIQFVDMDIQPRTLWRDVEVVPTEEQVSRGSELSSHISMPNDATCTICQDHDLAGSSEPTWRRLYCLHSFHRECIDRWFETNVHCPVCRADIRDAT
jgi:Ring finger domain